MRDRDEILRKMSPSVSHEIVEVLLDIRDLLIASAESTGRCGHGNTGICMDCVIRFDLMRPRQGG